MPLSDGPRTAPGYMTQANLYGATVPDELESVKDLQWPASIETYSKMRNDPQIAATLNSYVLPLGAGKWAVDGEGCRPEVTQYISDAWGLPVLGTETKRTGFRRRGVLWSEHLRLALLSLVYGHMPFAFAGEITGLDGNTPRWRMTQLVERMPYTISDIVTNDDGSLKGIYQYGSETLIPAQNLVWYAHAREGANWAGRSMLREAYGPWLLKHDMWRVLGISSRRFGMGVPLVTAPPGSTQAEVDYAAQLAQQMRAGDQGGAGMPDGYKAALMGLTGSVPDTLGFVKYLDSQIAQAVLASVLNLPSSDTGNRALGETLIGLLRQSWGAIAREISLPANRLNVRMVDINWGTEEPVPEIVCTGLGAPEATAESITALITAGAITADPELEAWLRQRYELPEIDEEFTKKPPTEYGLPAPGSPDAPASQGGNPENAPDQQQSQKAAPAGQDAKTSNRGATVHA